MMYFFAFLLFLMLGYAYLVVIYVITRFILSILNIFTKPILKLDVLDEDNPVNTPLASIFFLLICMFCAYILWQNQSVFVPVSVTVFFLSVYLLSDRTVG